MNSYAKTLAAACLLAPAAGFAPLHAGHRASIQAANKWTLPARPSASVASWRLSATETEEQTSLEELEEENSDIRQLLGFRGATTDTAAPFNWKIRLQLTKPGTWVPLIWGVACGAAASGNYHAIWNMFGDAPTTDSWSEVTEDTFKAMGAMFLSGPLLTGFTQTINDWYDRDLDAINEPYRPIPSGAISQTEVISQIWFLLLAGLGLSLKLDQWAGNDWPVIFSIAVFGSLVSYGYSAPPLKFKQEGWQGTYALGASYIALPWWCGHAMFNAGSISPQEIVLTVLYSLAGVGIAIVNDFKSVEGDRELGMNSLPVAFGIDTAKYICVGTIDFTQLGVAYYLYSIGELQYALILMGLIVPQMFFQFAPGGLIEDPVANDVSYQGKAQPFLVFGILTTALAVGHHAFN